MGSFSGTLIAAVGNNLKGVRLSEGEGMHLNDLSLQMLWLLINSK